MKMPFKQRENIELYLKGAADYGLKEQDLFQVSRVISIESTFLHRDNSVTASILKVNDLYESKNLYMVVDNLCSLGGCAQKLGFDGPALGARQASANKRQFNEDTLKAGQAVIGLQYGTNKCASQKGMTAPGTGRQIRPDGTSTD